MSSIEPVVIRGIVRDWPLVAKAREGIQKISEYLLCYYENDRIIAFASKPELGKKFTYGSNDNQMSFEKLESTLDLILETISESSKSVNSGTVYMGSTTLDYVLPGLDKDNNISIGDANPLKSIWVGNQTIVPPHYDVPDNIAFVCAVVRTRFNHFDHSIIEASYDLGGKNIVTFIKITLPIIFPGVLAGSLLAFTLSVDEFIIAFFTAGAGSSSTTLPMLIYSMIRFGVTPEINALSTFIILFSFIILFTSLRLNKESVIS